MKNNNNNNKNMIRAAFIVFVTVMIILSTAAYAFFMPRFVSATRSTSRAGEPCVADPTTGIQKVL